MYNSGLKLVFTQGRLSADMYGLGYEKQSDFTHLVAALSINEQDQLAIYKVKCNNEKCTTYKH